MLSESDSFFANLMVGWLGFNGTFNTE